MSTAAKKAKDRATQRQSKIRTLRAGETVPAWEPRRYPSANGYVRLRWTVAPYEVVEVYEHRVIDGRVTEAQAVHHINHNRSDNRPENLSPGTHAEHRAQHRRLDYDEIARLYVEGLSTPQIAERLGTDSSAVLRALRTHGIPTRSISESLRRPTDDALIRYLHGEGYRARAIAKHLGVSSYLIDCRFRELGLQPFPTGRPPR